MTKRNEALATLRGLDAAALDDHLRQQRRKLFEIRLQQATGQVDNFRQIREIHKELARTMTVQFEISHGIDQAPVAVEPVAKPRVRKARAPKAAAEVAVEEKEETDE